MGLTLFYKIFPTFSMSDGVFCIILPVVEKNVMDLNNVMLTLINYLTSGLYKLGLHN